MTSPTIVSFGNGERAATVILTRQVEGTGGAIIFVPFIRHVPFTTLYIRLPEDDVLNNFVNAVVLVGLTVLAICQIGKNGPTASEITNCFLPSRVKVMPTRIVRRASA